MHQSDPSAAPSANGTGADGQALKRKHTKPGSILSESSGLSSSSESSSNMNGLDRSDQATLRAWLNPEGVELMDAGAGSAPSSNIGIGHASTLNTPTFPIMPPEQQLIWSLSPYLKLLQQQATPMNGISGVKQNPVGANSLPGSQPSSNNSSTPKTSVGKPTSFGSCASMASQPSAGQPQKSPPAPPSLLGSQMPFSPLLNVNAQTIAAILAQQMQANQHHHNHGHPHVHQQQPQLTTAVPFNSMAAMTPQQLVWFKLNQMIQEHQRLNKQQQPQPCMASPQAQQMTPNQIQMLIQMLTPQQNQKNGFMPQPAGINPTMAQQANIGQKMAKGMARKNCQNLTNGTNVQQKPGKRRSSVNSQGSISSQGTGSSSSTTLSMQSQQPGSNGTPITPRTPISSVVERMSMDDKVATAVQIGQAKQKRNNSGLHHQKEVTSAGGRVPKKTRRMSMDIDDSPAVPMEVASTGATPKSSKKRTVEAQHSLELKAASGGTPPINIKPAAVQQQQQQGVSSVSPNGSGYDSSSPTGTIASPTEQRTNFTCEWEQCKVEFRVEEEFVAHVRDVHCSAEQGPHFFCRWSSCKRDKPFNAQYMLAQHVRKHSGEKPYQCDFVDNDGQRCQKRYSRLENKKTHERSHTGQRPYKCQHCTKEFTNASDKAKHQNRTHKDKKDYACPVFQCPKEYTDPSSLRKHVNHEHGPKVWHFAKEYKETKRAKNYGVIGITKDGTPFAMPSGTSSSDEDREVDVTGGTTPPPGGKLPTLNENDGGDDCMGGSTNSIAGILPFDANDVHMEIKQEAHSPEDMSSPAMNGFGQNNEQQLMQHQQHNFKQSMNARQQHQQHISMAFATKAQAIPPLHASQTLNQQHIQNWHKQQNMQMHQKVAIKTDNNNVQNSPIRASKATAIATVNPLPQQQYQQQHSSPIHQHAAVQQRIGQQGMFQPAYSSYHHEGSSSHTRRQSEAAFPQNSSLMEDPKLLMRNSAPAGIGGRLIVGSSPQWTEAVAHGYGNAGDAIAVEQQYVHPASMHQHNLDYSKCYGNMPAPFYQQMPAFPQHTEQQQFQSRQQQQKGQQYNQHHRCNPQYSLTYAAQQLADRCVSQAYTALQTRQHYAQPAQSGGCQGPSVQHGHPPQQQQQQYVQRQLSCTGNGMGATGPERNRHYSGPVGMAYGQQQEQMGGTHFGDGIFPHQQQMAGHHRHMPMQHQQMHGSQQGFAPQYQEEEDVDEMSKSVSGINIHDKSTGSG